MAEQHATGSRAANPMMVAQRIVDEIFDAIDPPFALEQADKEALYWLVLMRLGKEFGPGWAGHLRERANV